MKNKLCIVVANYYPKISLNLVLGASKLLSSYGIKKIKVLNILTIYITKSIYFIIRNCI